MKILSKSCKYAVRAVLFLSMNSNSKKVFSSKEIAHTLRIPAPFLAKTLQQLAKKKLISTKRGRNGGFYLTEENKSKSILSIVYSIDEIDKFEECELGLPECGDIEPCPIHPMISAIKETLIEELSSKTIDNLAEEVKKGNAHIVLNKMLDN